MPDSSDLNLEKRGTLSPDADRSARGQDSNNAGIGPSSLAALGFETMSASRSEQDSRKSIVPKPINRSVWRNVLTGVIYA